MAGAKDVTIRAQALDSTWQVIGGGAARGLYPENVTLEADVWGSSRASFNLRRDPTSFWPDIGAFTPVEIDVGSTLVWSGRVSDTPSRVAQRVMNVQCEGWQYHLDDDIYERVYVHTKLGDWVDARAMLTSPLGNAADAYYAAGSVATGGVITLALPKDTAVAAFARVGVILDLGPNAAATRLVMTWESSNNAAAGQVVIQSTATPTSAATTLGAFALNTGASGTTAGTGPGNRYFTIFLRDSGAGHTPTADEWLRITSVTVFADTAYESGNRSILKATDVIGDALDRATVRLSSDRSGIQATSFSVPSYAPGAQTPRQAWAAVDAYHDWLKQIDVQRRPTYQPKPSRPVFEVGAWSPLDDDDASANSGAEIYNRVVVQAQTPDGVALRVERTAGQQAGVPLLAISAPAPDNPSFAVDAASWTASGGTLTRSTTAGEFDSAPAGGKWVPTTGGQTLTETFTGTFKAGVIYVLNVALKTSLDELFVTGTFGQGSDIASRTGMSGSLGFTTYAISWMPVADRTSVTLVLTATIAGGTVFVDTLALFQASPTLVDRRGFRRSMILPVQSALPSDAAAGQAIGDLWLASHKTTPFKGSATLNGDGALRNILTGVDVPLEQLLVNTGQLVRFSDRSDPDTGGHGRDGRIVQVSYQPATNSAQVAFDNSRTDLSTLLSRLAVIQGG